jgi:hypothetical protein
MVFNTFLGKGKDKAWYLTLDMMSEFDMKDVHVLVSSVDLRFRSIEPAPVMIAGSKAELSFPRLERNTRLTFRFEFE